LGAGRSGTTLLATILNTNEDVVTLGEMHQFKDYLNGEKACSCGEKLQACPFWKEIQQALPQSTIEGLEYCEKCENHKNIPKLLFTKKPNQVYLGTQENIFQNISKQSPKKALLDSSKYIGRYLLLSKSKNLNIRGIYVVRDIRGVINSFNKKVQTPKLPISTILYYGLINFFGQLVCWMDRKVVKVKYEDFVDNPRMELERINKHVFLGEEKKVTLPEFLEVPHIIGGNRMKSEKKIHISPDFKWKTNINRGRQIVYYLALLPFMLINNYKI
jgi:hypothetical protein